MESEPTRVLLAVSESTIRGYLHASISSRGAFEWTIQKIVRSNTSGFRLHFLHVQVPNENGAWKPLGISGHRRARLRKEVLMAREEDWSYDPERKEMKTRRKGHKVDRIAAKKRENTAKLMEKMPEMLLDYKKRKWEKKMKEEEKAKDK
ncbi:hypothetical protein EZV62_024174 [Acer yangbiense]|uniref:Uncharacterized protein n=1 Tax=Acer yangbiense TaxID=1000413 RepID=A0A5C7H3T0_9ROSI|nr:hypothetical protein EZV62_024174 [Acer yangbiense]